MYLPEEIERQLRYEIKKYEEEQTMPHVTSFEKFAREEGMEQGLEQGLEQGILEGIKLMLDFKFGDSGLRLLPEISEIKNAELLRKILAGLKTANSPEELRKIYRQQNSN